MAMDLEGNFIVTWQAAFQDGDGYGVYARRFDDTGSAIGDEFQVNTSTAGHQGVPSVAMSPVDGSAVIVWQGPDADGLGIFGQRYIAAGSPVGGEFQLNTHTQLDQVSPAISMNAAGQFAVVWVSDHRAVFDPTDTEKSIFVQWYDADGSSAGEEALVHSIQPEFEAQEHPDVALDANGNFVVAWQSINQDGNTWGVFARQFLADKSPVQPIEFQINQTVLAPQRHPSVISDAEGNFVVAWQAHKQDTSGPGVMARVYDSLAVAQTDEFLVPTSDQGPQTSPVMAMAPTGHFGIFWTGHGIDRAEGAHGRIYTLEQIVDGDFNFDDVFDSEDIDALVAEIAAGTNGLAFDMTGDGLVDLADRDAWLAAAGEVNLGPGTAYLLADANLDGYVDGLDFIAWNANKFTSLAKWSAGDFNADRFIDALDFLIWNANKFQSSEGAADVVLLQRSLDLLEIDETTPGSNESGVDESSSSPPLVPLVAHRVDAIFGTSRRGEDHEDELAKGRIVRGSRCRSAHTEAFSLIKPSERS